MFSPKFAGNDYFTGSPETTLNSTEYSSRQTPSVSSVYVSNCLFNKCTISSGNGGALFLSASVSYLFIESSSFFSCKTNSGEGGAIYFYNTNSGQSVLYSVCGNDCYSTNYGPFSRIDMQNIVTNKNFVNYTSIARCVSDASRSYCMLCILYGKIYCPSINMSMNKCQEQSGILYEPFIDSSSDTSSLSYSTFADNNAFRYSCIWCNNRANFVIKCCNILRNTQGTLSSYGIIFARGNLMIKDSCILENTANYIFYQESTSYTITLSNCTVDSISHYYSFTIQNSATKSFIHGLNHISTQNCHSEYDSAGILTAIPYVSQSTKKVICHTCHCQPQISDSFTIIWLFIITFIHPNPSGDCCYNFYYFCV
jgi:hypothetical protein